MRRLLVTTVLLLTGLTVGSSAQTAPTRSPAPSLTDQQFIEQVYYPATVLLFSQNEDGGMKMLCTATAFEKTLKGYRFVTAAHCASTDDSERHKADVGKRALFISADALHTKEFIEATVVACGYQSRGDDFCILSVETIATFPIVRIGDDSQTLSGDPLVNIASPMGLGKQVFYGRVTLPRADRTLLADDINWTGAMLLQVPGTNGGSSGSALVCLHQQAICGFLVGIIGGTTQVGIPVSRFKEFVKAVNSHTYKWFDDDPDEPEVFRLPLFHKK